MTTGTEEIACKHLYKDEFDVRMIAGQIAALNALPAAGDSTYGFVRRNVVIEMRQEFFEAEDDGSAPPPGVFVADKLVTKKLRSEIPAIVTWLVEGARKAVVRGRIVSPPASSKEPLEQWQSKSDPVRRWLLARCVGVVLEPDLPQKSIAETIERLYTSYSSWAEDNGHVRINSATFEERLRNTVKNLARSNPEFFGLVDGAEDASRLKSGIGQIRTSGCRRVDNQRRFPVRLKVDVSEEADQAETMRLLNGV